MLRAQEAQARSRHSYSLRERLDLAAGALLLFLTAGSCLALGLTQYQQRQVKFLKALHEQERLVYELSRANDPLAVRDTLDQLERNLRTLQTGGTLLLRHGHDLRVRPLQDRFMAEHLTSALASIERSRKGAGDVGDLQTFLQSIAAGAESQSLAQVLRASWLQLIFIFCGTLFFLGGVVFLRRLVTTPLHRMADGIEAMRRTGRLVKLPVMHANELGVVASGFNQLAEEVEEQKRRLREHIVELQRVNIELDQLANLKDDFLATINHQIRTPLTTIVEGLALCSDGTMGPMSEDQRSLMQTMHRNAEQLTNLVENMLDLSMLKSGRRPLKRRPGDLAAMLRQAQATWQSMARSCTIQLTCEELPPVFMDGAAIQDVLDHLVRNALRHAPQRSRILVKAHARNGVAEISVADQGPGLSPEQLNQLFQPFVHLQTPDAPGSQGSGLGLAFCHQVIERHHGSIRAQSTEGQGTTMTFTLPVASAQFLFEEACRVAREEAEEEGDQFGLLCLMPAAHGGAASVKEAMRRAEAILRSNTHRGDQFVRVDERTLVIVAVTDRAGLTAMAKRLRSTLTQAALEVVLTSAHCPTDGEQPAQLLEAARRQQGGTS